jgi:hypothetical protein
LFQNLNALAADFFDDTCPVDVSPTTESTLLPFLGASAPAHSAKLSDEGGEESLFGNEDVSRGLLVTSAVFSTPKGRTSVLEDSTDPSVVLWHFSQMLRCSSERHLVAAGKPACPSNVEMTYLQRY